VRPYRDWTRIEDWTEGGVGGSGEGSDNVLELAPAAGGMWEREKAEYL
jgi:hypothetical protein